MKKQNKNLYPISDSLRVNSYSRLNKLYPTLDQSSLVSTPYSRLKNIPFTAARPHTVKTWVLNHTVMKSGKGAGEQGSSRAGEQGSRGAGEQGSRDGAVVRALTSHQCGPGSTPGPSIICGQSLYLLLVLALRCFSPGAPVFPSPQKPTHPNSNSILEVSPISILC